MNTMEEMQQTVAGARWPQILLDCNQIKEEHTEEDATINDDLELDINILNSIKNENEKLWKTVDQNENKNEKKTYENKRNQWSLSNQSMDEEETTSENGVGQNLNVEQYKKEVIDEIHDEDVSYVRQLENEDVARLEVKVESTSVQECKVEHIIEDDSEPIKVVANEDEEEEEEFDILEDDSDYSVSSDDFKDSIDQESNDSDYEICDKKKKKKKQDKYELPGSNQSTYMCKDCEQTFVRKNHLFLHKKYCPFRSNPENKSREQSHHKKYQCPTCKYQTDKANHLKRHMITHIPKEKDLLKCGDCDYKTVRKDAMKRHVLQVHTTERPYQCKLCDYKCVESGALKKHELKHFPDRKNKYTCDICSKVFFEKRYLNEHLCMANKTTKASIFKCSDCDYTAKNQSDLKHHHKQKHYDSKPYQCKICGFKLSSAKTLKRHMYKHCSTKPHQCSKCSYKCIRPTQLKTHYKKYHQP